MTNAYRAVQWNAHKRNYDLVVGVTVVTMVAAFVAVSVATATPMDDVSPEILVIRALGAGAGALLTVLLCIGPLARLDRRALPLLRIDTSGSTTPKPWYQTVASSPCMVASTAVTTPRCRRL